MVATMEARRQREPTNEAVIPPFADVGHQGESRRRKNHLGLWLSPGVFFAIFCFALAFLELQGGQSEKGFERVSPEDIFRALKVDANLEKTEKGNILFLL